MRCEVFVGDRAGSGNPALVCSSSVSAPNPAEPMVVGVEVSSSPRRVVFDAPRRRLPFCGHGALAAAYWLARRDGRRTVEFRTDAFDVVAEVQHDDVVGVSIPSPSWTVRTSDSALAAALGVPEVGRVFCAEMGSPKLIVEVRAEHLARAHIEDGQLAALLRGNGLNGVLLVADDDGDRLRARGFNPLASEREDRATGVGVAALAACLGRAVIVEQGPIGSPTAVLHARPDGDRVVLSGRVRELHAPAAEVVATIRALLPAPLRGVDVFADLRDSGLDSMGLLVLCSSLETAFGLEFEDDDLEDAHFTTIAAIGELLARVGGRCG